MATERIDREAIAATYHSIRSHVRFTPTLDVDPSEFGAPKAQSLTLKLEFMQHAGSFKPRGAFANLLSRDDTHVAGVAAASGGNHGAAVAYAAHQLNHQSQDLRSPVCLGRPRLREFGNLGGDVVVAGAEFGEVLANCTAYVEESGALNIHAYDQHETLLGQGTIGLELEMQAPSIETILVAVGGGGLIGGITAWYRDRLAIIGVEPATSCALHAALEAGHPVDVPVSGLAADSLGAQRIGELAFPLARAYVERVALVDDSAIADAQWLLWEQAAHRNRTRRRNGPRRRVVRGLCAQRRRTHLCRDLWRQYGSSQSSSTRRNNRALLMGGGFRPAGVRRS